MWHWVTFKCTATSSISEKVIKFGKRPSVIDWKSCVWKSRGGGYMSPFPPDQISFLTSEAEWVPRCLLEPDGHFSDLSCGSEENCSSRAQVLNLCTGLRGNHTTIGGYCLEVPIGIRNFGIPILSEYRFGIRTDNSLFVWYFRTNIETIVAFQERTGKFNIDCFLKNQKALVMSMPGFPQKNWILNSRTFPG